MTDLARDEVIDSIVNPRPENAQKLLVSLGFDRLPSREQVHRNIEEKFLLPKDQLPEDWLSDYQM